MEKENPNLQNVIEMARKEPILILTSDGKEFFLSEADDFEREVEMLRRSQAFQRFLDERSACAQRIPLEDVEKEIERELAADKKGA
ncbi:hypothetical protein FJY63_10310 [Candidatus Sumerlaeota bacterium]|nr:hypothetical protein [Candidatus Sumerlaeota bacterium]